MIRSTITFFEADAEAVRDALLDSDSRLRNWSRGWVYDDITGDLTAPVYTEDVESDTEIDADGNFTGTVSGRIIRLHSDPHISRIVSDILTAATITHELLDTVEGDVETEEDGTDAHLAEFSQRRPGRMYEAFGTFTADGAKPGQTVNLPGKIIDQWNGVVKFRNLDKDAAAGTVTLKAKSAGDYEVKTGIDDDANLSPGVTWTFQSTVNNVGTGNTDTSDDGEIRITFSLPGLSVNDVIGVGTRPDTGGRTFKVTAAKARIRRTG